MCAAARLRGLCRAGNFARRLGFAVSQVFRDDASIVPYGCGAGHCRVLEGHLCGKAAMHPSGCALRRIQLPLQGSLPSGGHPQSLPCKGRCPQRGRRGALPPCPAGILQTPAGPCPASVGDDACIVPETLRWRKPQAAGENARPTKPPRVGSNAQTPAIRQARRGAWCQPRRILARQGAAPLRRLGRHLPLQGRLYRRQSPPKPPLQGEVDAPQGADGGVHCRLAAEIPGKARQGLVPHP